MKHVKIIGAEGGNCNSMPRHALSQNREKTFRNPQITHGKRKCKHEVVHRNICRLLGTHTHTHTYLCDIEMLKKRQIQMDLKKYHLNW